MNGKILQLMKRGPFRGKQLRKHRLIAFNINPITFILYWCKALLKRKIVNGIIQL